MTLNYRKINDEKTQGKVLSWQIVTRRAFERRASAMIRWRVRTPCIGAVMRHQKTCVVGAALLRRASAGAKLGCGGLRVREYAVQGAIDPVK